MTLHIESMRGMWRAQIEHRTEFADTLEELLLKLAPTAQEEYVWHAAEVLGGILGAEVVEVPQIDMQPIRPGEVEALMELLGLDVAEGEPWQPTEAQQAYFEGERSEEADSADFSDLADGFA